MLPEANMRDNFGDARVEELLLLAELDRIAGRMADNEILHPGPRRQMIATLIQEGFVNDFPTSWDHNVGAIGLETKIHLERLSALNNVLGGQPTSVRISHRGRVRLSELKQALQANRIRDSFGILLDQRHIDTDLRIAVALARES